MNLTVNEPGRRLTIEGRVTSADLPDLRQVVLRQVDMGLGDLVLDVHRVVVTDRCVLGLLLEAHRRAERHGRRVLLLNVPITLGRLLRRTGVGRLLNCVIETAPLPTLVASR
ncbi:MAG: STAS domain-containing protein [Actinomycetales bacterium]